MTVGWPAAGDSRGEHEIDMKSDSIQATLAIRGIFSLSRELLQSDSFRASHAGSRETPAVRLRAPLACA